AWFTSRTPASASTILRGIITVSSWGAASSSASRWRRRAPGASGYDTASFPWTLEVQLKRDRLLDAILVFVCALVLPSLSAAQSPEESGWGPAFGSRSLYALHVPVFDFGPALTRALAPGESEW